MRARARVVALMDQNVPRADGVTASSLRYLMYMLSAEPGAALALRAHKGTPARQRFGADGSSG